MEKDEDIEKLVRKGRMAAKYSKRVDKIVNDLNDYSDSGKRMFQYSVLFGVMFLGIIISEYILLMFSVIAFLISGVFLFAVGAVERGKLRNAMDEMTDFCVENMTEDERRSLYNSILESGEIRESLRDILERLNPDA